MHKLLSRAQSIYNQLVEVKDHLPIDVAISLGLAPLPLTETQKTRTDADDLRLPEEGSFVFSSARSTDVTTPPKTESPAAVMGEEDDLQFTEEDSFVFSNETASPSHPQPSTRADEIGQDLCNPRSSINTMEYLH